MNYEPDSEAVTAAIADVEPLDALTKARLVKTAMQATATARRGRWLGVAAAIVAVALVTGGAVAVLTRNDGSRPVADSSVAPTDAAAGSSAADSTDTPVALGDLGAVDDDDALRARLESVAKTPTLSSDGQPYAAWEGAYDQTVSKSCSAPEARPDENLVTAWATAVWKGELATVALATVDGTQYAFVLTPDQCTVLARVEL